MIPQLRPMALMSELNMKSNLILILPPFQRTGVILPSTNSSIEKNLPKSLMTTQKKKTTRMMLQPILTQSIMELNMKSN
jgi:maleate cis-trans isomerase